VAFSHVEKPAEKFRSIIVFLCLHSSQKRRKIKEIFLSNQINPQPNYKKERAKSAKN
jgi:hypothetical protein